MSSAVKEKLFVSFVIIATISFSFYWSLDKLPVLGNENTYAQIGVVCGFLSASTWGISVLGGPLWNAWFNFIAADLAAMSLGYLTKSPF